MTDTLESEHLTPRQLDAVIDALNFVLADDWDADSHNPSDPAVHERALSKMLALKGRIVSVCAPGRVKSEALGAWMSAALDDPAVCDAMKADIRAWFDAGKPPYSDTLLRRDALAEIDRFIEVWRNSGIDACLAEIETLLLVREKIAGLTPPRIDEHVWSGDGTLGSSDGFDGPICLRCRIGDYGTDTPPECKP